MSGLLIFQNAFRETHAYPQTERNWIMLNKDDNLFGRTTALLAVYVSGDKFLISLACVLRPLWWSSRLEEEAPFLRKRLWTYGEGRGAGRKCGNCREWEFGLMRLNWAYPDKCSRTALPGPFKAPPKCASRKRDRKTNMIPLGSSNTDCFFLLLLCAF